MCLICLCNIFPFFLSYHLTKRFAENDFSSSFFLISFLPFCVLKFLSHFFIQYLCSRTFEGKFFSYFHFFLLCCATRSCVSLKLTHNLKLKKGESEGRSQMKQTRSLAEGEKKWPMNALSVRSSNYCVQEDNWCLPAINRYPGGLETDLVEFFQHFCINKWLPHRKPKELG